MVIIESHELRNYFKGSTRELGFNSDRRGGARIGLNDRVDAMLKRSEVNRPDILMMCKCVSRAKLIAPGFRIRDSYGAVWFRAGCRWR